MGSNSKERTNYKDVGKEGSPNDQSNCDPGKIKGLMDLSGEFDIIVFIKTAKIR